MAGTRKSVVNIHSSVTNKEPNPSSINYGELAVNYSTDNEFISAKNANGRIARFSSDKVIMKWVEKKEVFPVSGEVVTTGDSATIDLTFNQKVSQNSPGAAEVSGTSGVSIDASAFALTGSDVSFSNVTVTGNLAFGTTSQTSDERAKENIADISEEALDKIKNVKLHEFNFKSDPERKMYGVIAQEVEKTGLNELVHTDKNGMKSVDYTGVLILKIAELEKKYNELLKKLEEK